MGHHDLIDDSKRNKSGATPNDDGDVASIHTTHSLSGRAKECAMLHTSGDDEVWEGRSLSGEAGVEGNSCSHIECRVLDHIKVVIAAHHNDDDW